MPRSCSRPRRTAPPARRSRVSRAHECRRRVLRRAPSPAWPARRATCSTPISFPRFVTELITGVFKAMVETNQQQLQQYVELVRGVSQSLDGFAALAAAATTWPSAGWPTSSRKASPSSSPIPTTARPRRRARAAAADHARRAAVGRMRCARRSASSRATEIAATGGGVSSSPSCGARWPATASRCWRPWCRWACSASSSTPAASAPACAFTSTPARPPPSSATPASTRAPRSAPAPRRASAGGALRRR